MDHINASPLILAAIFVGSAALSAALVWISIIIANRKGIFDHPDGERKLQDRPIPKLGGVAVAVAFTVVALSVLTKVSDLTTILASVGLLTLAVSAAVLGYVDDKRPLDPGPRLFFQALIGAGVWYLFELRQDLTGNEVVDFTLVTLWVMILINGVNLLDNSDGLAGTTVLVSALVCGLVAGITGQYLITALAFAVAGTAAGFLFYNWFPARVYMGDSGAYFFGTMLAILTLRIDVSQSTPPWNYLIPMLIVSLPLLDTTFVVVNRLRKGIHPFTAGTDHLSHQLQGRGLSVALSVLTLQVILVASGVAALMLVTIFQ